MNWQQLISNKRLGQETRHERHDDRSEFKRDSDRLIYSAPFRRLQNKTQVFPLPGSIFVHNRLTHSLEVSSLGKSLGDDVARILTERHPELRGTLFEEIGTIVQTAGLAHDLGNPPFGHSGEKAIQAFFTEGEGQELRTRVSDRFWDDITHFEGNANAFRILTHRFHGRREGGFVMTYSTLASIVKYPFASSEAGGHGKFGFFAPEEDSYRKIADELGIARLSADGEPLRYARHPLVYLMEAADDICYEIMDIEDAHKLKLLTYQETEDLLLGFFDSDTRAYKRCTQVSKERIYQSKIVLDVELSGYKIMETLMRDLVSAAVSPEKFHSKQLIKRFSSQYDIQSDDLETRLMAVIDYISGMTDIYALDIYQKINGISLPII